MNDRSILPGCCGTVFTLWLKMEWRLIHWTTARLISVMQAAVTKQLTLAASPKLEVTVGVQAWDEHPRYSLANTYIIFDVTAKAPAGGSSG